MGYQTLIDAKLNQAFNLVKDLAIDIVLTKKQDSTFNFGTGEVKFGSQSVVNTKAIPIDLKKTSENRNTIEKQLMLKSKEVGDITKYATVQFQSKTWNIGDIPKDDGFILLVNVYREA
jgi:hypothetical protein